MSRSPGERLESLTPKCRVPCRASASIEVVSVKCVDVKGGSKPHTRRGRVHYVIRVKHARCSCSDGRCCSNLLQMCFSRKINHITYKEERTRFEIPELTSLNCLQFSSNGKYLAAGTTSGQVVIWDINKRKPVFRLDDEDKRSVLSMAWKEELVLVGSVGGTLTTIRFCEVSQRS